MLVVEEHVGRREWLERPLPRWVLALCRAPLVPVAVVQRRRCEQAFQVGESLHALDDADDDAALSQLDFAPVVEGQALPHPEHHGARRLSRVQADRDLVCARCAHALLTTVALVDLQLEPSPVERAAEQPKDADALERVLVSVEGHVMWLAKERRANPPRTVAVWPVPVG